MQRQQSPKFERWPKRDLISQSSQRIGVLIECSRYAHTNAVELVIHSNARFRNQNPAAITLNMIKFYYILTSK